MLAWRIGWTGAFRSLGLHGQIMIGGLLAVAALFGLAIFRMRSVSDLLAFSGVAMVLFLNFSLICWNYVYYAPLLVLFFAAWPDERPALASPGRRGRLLYMLTPFATAAVLASGTAVYHGASAGGHRRDGVLRADESGRTRELWRKGWGAVEGRKNHRRRNIVNRDANAAVPVASKLDERRLEIELVSDGQAPLATPLLLVAYVNGERLGKAVIPADRPAQSLVFPVPDGNLFRGLNEVHLSFRHDLANDGDLIREHAPLAGLALRSLRLAPAP